jgi:hypothetical protein
MIPYLYHNLGLGDHIICNALVRHYEHEYGLINLFAKHHNVASVKAMFYGLDVNVIGVRDDAEVEEIIKRNSGHKVYRIGCTGEGWKTIGPETFDEVFYRQAGIPFERRWSGFKYEITPTAPHERMYCDGSEKFIFIHDDFGRGFNIRPEYYKRDKKILTPKKGMTENVLMWDRFLHSAEEIHCINSSFLLLADSIPTTGKLFYHKYARNEGEFCNPKLKKDWQVIE